MRILDRSVYVGPSLYARFPVIRLELDLGALEAWPTGRLGGGFVDALAAALPGPRRARLLLSRARRLLPAHARGRGHLARPRARARRDRAAEHRRRGSHLRQDPQRRARPGVYTVVYEYAQRDEGIAAGELGLRLLCSLLPPRSAAGRLGAGGLELAGGARPVHPLRAAPCARPLDRLAGARRRAAATSRGCASTISRWCSWATASTSSASRRPSPGARRTSRWSWRATRRRPTRSSPTSACRCRSRSWCRARRRRCAPRAASASRWSPSPTTATTAAASRSA